MRRRISSVLPQARVWRSQGKGPNYYKVGSTVRYEMDDLEAWKNENVKHVELAN